MSESRAKLSQPRALLSRIQTDPADSSRDSLKTRWVQWAVSLTMHLVALAFFGLCFFTIHPPSQPTFDATLMAGDPAGDPIGWSSRMGGLDVPEPQFDASRMTVDDRPALTIAPFLTKVVRTEPKSGGGVGAGGGRGGEGFGAARFGPGTEEIRGKTVKTGNPQFTLLWDSQVDLDLHVTEPGGAQLYWKVKGQPTARGGMLDVDNVQGFGPENVFWLHGQGPAGEYRWYVEYYGGFGGYDQPTRWQVRIKQNGTEQLVEGRLRKIGEKSRVFTLKFTPDSESAAGVD